MRRVCCSIAMRHSMHQELLDAGADPNIPDYKGLTAMHYAGMLPPPLPFYVS